MLCFMLHTLVVRETTLTTEPLAELRQQIDRLDDELLALMAKRMRISREIGQYKKEHSMPILQAKRYDEILNKRGAQAVELGINPEFVKTLLQAIHEGHQRLTRSPTGGNPSAAEDIPTQKQPVGKRGGAGFVRTMPRRENEE